MLTTKSLVALLALLASPFLLAAPIGTTTDVILPSLLAGRAADTQVVSKSTTGTYGGYYYSNYVESGTDTLTLGTGTYQLKWSSSNQDVVSGIGWSTGSAR